MKLTFYTQRKHVNQGENIKNLLEEWPFLFDELGMAVHFQELTRIGLKEAFTRNLDLKGKRLLNYMKTVCVNKSRKFLQALTKYQVMRGELSGCSEDLKDMVLLLLSYFNEKEDAIFCYVEDTCLAGEVHMDQVPLTPTIVVCVGSRRGWSLSQHPFGREAGYTLDRSSVHRRANTQRQTTIHSPSHTYGQFRVFDFCIYGRSCYSATRFMLSVDQNIVQDSIPSFMSALCLMFGSYYCFNIHYPSCLASTLEFLQRCFFSINPEKGTKLEKTKTSRLHMNP